MNISSTTHNLSLTRFTAMVFLVLFGCFILLKPSTVSAANGLESVCTQFPDSEVCKQAAADPKGDKVGGSDGILVKIINLIIYLTAAVCLLMIIFGAFKYVTSNGEANQTKSAKDTIIYALIGLFIAINAMAVVRFAISKLP